MPPTLPPTITPAAINVLVVDDEPLMRFHLQKSLTELWEDAELIITANSGYEALSLIEEMAFHTVFLDIKMPSMDGLETAKQLKKQGFSGHIVFVTAYDQYAIQAFEQEALDYLLKPIEENRLMACIERIKKRVSAPPQWVDMALLQTLLPASAQAERHLSWLNVSVGDAIKVIPVASVYCFIAEDKYTTVVTMDGEALIRKPIKQLVEELDSTLFWRIHRAVIVQVSKILHIQRDEQGHMSLKLKDIDKELPVSRQHQALFKQM